MKDNLISFANCNEYLMEPSSMDQAVWELSENQNFEKLKNILNSECQLNFADIPLESEQGLTFSKEQNLFVPKIIAIQSQIPNKTITKAEDVDISTYINIAEDSIKPIFINQIFIEKSVRNHKKNTNVPKLLVRIYTKYYKKYNKLQGQMKHFRQVHQILFERSTNNFGISDLLILFQGFNRNAEFERRNRETMAKIIRGHLNEEILMNPFMKNNKHSYLMAGKIYALRCRCQALAERVKIS